MNLTPRQKQTLEAVAEHAPISRTRLASVLECSPQTAQQHLHHLRRAGLIRPTGTGRHSQWVTVRRPPPQPRPAIEQAASVWEYARRMGGME